MWLLPQSKQYLSVNITLKPEMQRPLVNAISEKMNTVLRSAESPDDLLASIPAGGSG